MATWREVSAFIRFAIYLILTTASVVAAWTALGLPQVASKDYVDGKAKSVIEDANAKFKVANDNSALVQSQMTSVRVQLNKMTRQNLESEKYRLSKEPNPSIDTAKRLQDIEEELQDVARERNFLLKP